MPRLHVALAFMLCGFFDVAPARAAAPSGAKKQLDPQMQRVIDTHAALGGVPVHSVSPQIARRGPSPANALVAVMEADGGVPAQPVPIDSIVDRRLRTASGPIPVRIYAPKDQDRRPAPAIVYFHGGGFVVADLDTYDASARALAARTNAVVISVHYRQAPEHPFPAAHVDAISAFDYVVDHARELGIDPARIAVVGESAGANLATNVAMHQQQMRGTRPVLQVLIYPFVSNDFRSASHRSYGTGEYLVSNADLGWFWQQFLGKGWRSSRDPRALPIYAPVEALRGLPPALVVLADADPLLDDGIAYADHLEKAGVRADVLRYAGVTHEFFGMAPVVAAAEQAQTEVARVLVDALRKPAPRRAPTRVSRGFRTLDGARTQGGSR